MSTEQRENLDAILRKSAFPVDSDVSELRRLTQEQAATQPPPAGVTVAEGALGLPSPGPSAYPGIVNDRSWT